ncbi:hypothetical protein MJ575_16615 [Klebsiella pneumoniae]|nr:hypothetical protein MJ575_16615 [Klebsiella pneumoniae]
MRVLDIGCGWGGLAQSWRGIRSASSAILSPRAAKMARRAAPSDMRFVSRLSASARQLCDCLRLRWHV